MVELSLIFMLCYLATRKRDSALCWNGGLLYWATTREERYDDRGSCLLMNKVSSIVELGSTDDMYLGYTGSDLLLVVKGFEW